ncbi:MAG: hypothetical protein IPM33_08810 [Phycisphaerales bacterium]|nr:hypothetical protein [Phycisphaerales bacterium]
MAWLQRELGVLSKPQPGGDPFAARRGEPRTFIAIWAAYLFGATLVSIGSAGAAGLLSVEVYRPAARVMLEAAAFGILFVWPLIRLSQAAPERPLRAFMIDSLIVALPVQIFAGVQALPWMAAWPRDVVGVMGGVLGAWSLLVGGVLTTYFIVGASRSLPRWVMMALLVALGVVGPALSVLDVRVLDRAEADACDAWMMTSPLSAVFEVTRDRPWTGATAAVGDGHRLALGVTLGAAGCVWILAAGFGLARGRGRAGESSLD